MKSYTGSPLLTTLYRLYRNMRKLRYATALLPVLGRLTRVPSCCSTRPGARIDGTGPVRMRGNSFFSSRDEGIAQPRAGFRVRRPTAGPGVGLMTVPPSRCRRGMFRRGRYE